MRDVVATATVGLLTAGARCEPSGGAVTVLTPGTGTPEAGAAFTAVLAVGRAGGGIAELIVGKGPVGRGGSGISGGSEGSGGRP